MPSKAHFMFPAERKLLAELGARLRLARQRRKLAASAVAEQAGISRTTLHGVESGDPAVTLGTYFKVLATLGMEQDIRQLASDDKIGRRLQDLRLTQNVSTSSPAEVSSRRTKAGGRPRSLREVALSARARGNTDALLREFLDEFYVASDKTERAAMLIEEPPLLEDDRANAYLAAVAEHLALRNQLPIPPWVSKEARFLRRPHFPSGLESLKATLLIESPAAFRRRMIFVGADPLYRPRKDAVGISPQRR